MKNKKFRKMIQKPLRFHHQDIHEELEEIKEMLKDVILQMQTMQQRVDQQHENTMLRLSEHDDNHGEQSFSLGSK
jgi:predicted transcriptional regulator YdeE